MTRTAAAMAAVLGVFVAPATPAQDYPRDAGGLQRVVDRLALRLGRSDVLVAEALRREVVELLRAAVDRHALVAGGVDGLVLVLDRVGRGLGERVEQLLTLGTDGLGREAGGLGRVVRLLLSGRCLRFRVILLLLLLEHAVSASAAMATVAAVCRSCMLPPGAIGAEGASCRAWCDRFRACQICGPW